MRDYGREQFNAVAERDALAAYQAKQRAEDQQSDEQKARRTPSRSRRKRKQKALASPAILRESADADARNQLPQSAGACGKRCAPCTNRLAERESVGDRHRCERRERDAQYSLVHVGNSTTVAVNGVQAILRKRAALGWNGGTDMYVNGLNKKASRRRMISMASVHPRARQQKRFWCG